MASHGRKYTEAREKIDREREYSPHEAVKVIAGTARSMGVETDL